MSAYNKSFGSLDVKVFETREIGINFIVGRVDETLKMSELKKSHSKSHQFSDVFRFQVGSATSELLIEAWRKNLIMKDTLKGVLKVPISTFFDEQVHTGWFKLTRPVKEKEDGMSDEEKNEGGEKKKSKKKEVNAEIRIEVKFTKNTPPKEVLTGIILNDEWTKETSGGPLVNNSKWVFNNQFLLNVDNDTDVHLKLRLPEGGSVRASFCVVHYDEFYNGRKKVVLDTSEIVKIDNFFAPITSSSVTSVMALKQGRYIIVPFTEHVGITGPFTLAVSAKNMDDIDLYKIPKDPSDDWNIFRVNGEWTLNTSGGGDILGLNWRKNPQYQLRLTQTSDVCCVIEQDENTRSIGIYVLKQIDEGKKVVDYSDEVGKTESFKYLCSTGLKIPKLSAGNYAIIPCTFDAEVVGPFRLATYVNNIDAGLSLVEHEWQHRKELKGAWVEGQAGGSPNNASFTSNPQFALNFKDNDKPVRFLIQLVQESAHYEEASIGFLTLKAKNGASKRLNGGDFGNDDIFCKPEGWAPKVDVVSRATISQGQDRSFIIIPSTFKPDILRSFQLNVYSEDEFTLDQI